MKLNLIYTLMSFFVLLLGNPVSVVANVNNGYIDIQWYNVNESDFEISKAEELAGLAKLVNEDDIDFSGKTIILTADIFLNDTLNWKNWDKNTPLLNRWIPIGTSSKPFNGTFNGNGYSVFGLYIAQTTQYQGLFGAIENAEIIKLGLSCFFMRPDKYAGGIVAYMNDSSIDSVYCIGNFDIDADANTIGGFAGNSVNSNISNVYSIVSLNLQKSGESIGGLIGNSENTILSRSYSDVDVNIYGSGSNVGGLIGYAKTSDISDVYNIGSINIKGAGAKVGGLIGYNDRAPVKNSYANNKISITGASDQTGSFVGYLADSQTSVISCYYNADANSNLKGIGNRILEEVKGKTTEEMKNKETFLGWNFNEIWSIAADKNNGYPYLFFGKNIVYGNKLYVKENGDNMKDASNWSNAITLVKALDIINSAPYDPEKSFEIWIAKGDYHAVDKAFRIKNNVLIRGGFTADDKSTKSTTLYGGDNNRTLIVYNRDNRINVTIDGLKIKEGTAHDEVTDLILNPEEITKYRGGGIFNANANTTLRYVVISGNVAKNKADNYPSKGGGIYSYSGNLILFDCLIESNIATKNNNEGNGGGIYLESSTDLVTISSSIIRNNIVCLDVGNNAVAKGGGIYADDNSLVLKNVSIESNIVTKGTGPGYGGGIYIKGGDQDVTISDAFIKNNLIINNPQNASVGQGGGIYNEQRNVNINNTSITQNVATTGTGNGSGGGIYHTSLYDPQKQKNITLKNSVISENIAFKNTTYTIAGAPIKGFGGGIYLGDGSVMINRCVLQKNMATYANENEALGGNGGAIYNVAGKLSVESVKIIENIATNTQGFGYGGGVSNMSDKEVRLFNALIARNAAGKQALGGGFCNTVGKNVKLTNVTIIGNTAGRQTVVSRAGDSDPVGGGSGVYNYNEGNLELQNTIVWHNEENDGIVQYLDNGASHFNRYCLVRGLNNEEGISEELNGINKPSSYPGFIDPANYNYRLKAVSPLRNKANDNYIDNNYWDEPGKDLDDNPRIDNKVDLGAFESNPHNVILSKENRFTYEVPALAERYGQVATNEYEVDMNDSFEFKLKFESGIIMSANVKVGDKDYFPDPVNSVYTIPDIKQDTHVEVSVNIEGYQIEIPEITGVSSNPGPGIHTVIPGDDFSFSLALDDAYSQSLPLVKANGKEIVLENGLYVIPDVGSSVVVTIDLLELNKYMVNLPDIEGLLITPGAGNHEVNYGGEFKFSVVKEKAYERGYNVSVEADNGYFVEIYDENTGEYRIDNIKDNIQVKILLKEKPIHKITLYSIDGIETGHPEGENAVYEGESFVLDFNMPEGYNEDDIDLLLDGRLVSYGHQGGNSYRFLLNKVIKNYTINIQKARRFIVELNGTEGVTCYPGTGFHRLGKFDDFTFSLVLDDDYDKSVIKVYSNEKEILPGKIDNNEYTYIIKAVEEDKYITIDGVKKNDFTGITNPEDDGVTVAVYNNTLTITVDLSRDIRIYTPMGNLIRKCTLEQGINNIQLPSGIYILTIGDKKMKIIIGK